MAWLSAMSGIVGIYRMFVIYGIFGLSVIFMDDFSLFPKMHMISMSHNGPAYLNKPNGVAPLLADPSPDNFAQLTHYDSHPIRSNLFMEV